MNKRIAKTFKQHFASSPLIARSPGRINIIGEHTDYNEGFVLPAAIDKFIYVAAAKRDDNKISLLASNFNEMAELSIADIKPSKSWPTYILGITDQLLKRGYPITGFNMVVDGDIPVGAGLSSSAALECSVVFALDELFTLGLSKMEMVDIAQKAEHSFAGLQCGIMDMFTSVFGKKNHVIKLDCRSLEYQYKPLQMEGYCLVLFNTNIRHSLSSSEYNIRRQQCEQGIAIVQRKFPFVKGLRDINMQMLTELVKPVDELVYRRCSYIVNEIHRLQSACEDLENEDLQALGKKMFLTHKGLSQDYEVSCNELDFLINAVKDNANVLGARMMGGGFGGCTINIIKQEAVNSLAEELGDAYKKATGLIMDSIIVQTSGGSEIISTKEHEITRY